MNIAVFCSGNGGNFQAIIDASRSGIFSAKVVLMVCDKAGAYALERAKQADVACLLLERQGFASREAFEEQIIEKMQENNIGLICLAGYMRIFSSEFIDKYRGRMLNVHPALLPAFKGSDAVKDAFEYGVKTTGVTVHFVTENIDAGPIILQEAVRIDDNDTQATLTEKIHKIEHRLYPQAIKLFVENRLVISGRKVNIVRTK